MKGGGQCITGSRWGDYFGAVLDPADNSLVWVCGEWAKVISGGDSTWDWGTWISSIRPTDCQIDNDGDGYVAFPCGNDCDDTNPDINPGKPEVCGDGLDNDCDGLVDCNDPDCQIDNDRDGHFAFPCGNDCDDTNPNINPGKPEVCDDGIDNDCDGMVDCDDMECANHPACVEEGTDLVSVPEGQFAVGPTSQRNGKRVRATLKVKNQGNQDSGKFVVKVFLSKDAKLDAKDKLKKTIPTSSLGTGKTRDLKIDIEDPRSMKGKYLIAQIDAGNTVAELNEDNNLAVEAIP